MKARVLAHRLDQLIRKKNALFVFVCALLLLNLLQAFVTLVRPTRVVVMPPTLTRTVWVEDGRVSSSYVEEMAFFFASLLLETSPESASYRRDLVLRNTSPEHYGVLKAKLLEDERRLQKERVVTSVQPVSVKVTGLKAEVTGDLSRFVGLKPISRSRDTYSFTFEVRGSRLLVQSFTLLGSDEHV